MPATPQHWMVKSEPAAYSWAQFLKDQRTAWTGVRNFQARNNLRSMKTGDLALFYHSVTEKAVVGIAQVVATAYPDPTASEAGWDCVDLAPVKTLPRPVPLEEIKASAALCDIALLRQSRLSVLPVTKAEYDALLALGR